MLIPSKFSGYRQDGIRYYPKKGDAPAPDPRMGEAALKQIEMAERQYNDYRTQDMPWMRSIADQALGISRDGANLARDQFGFSRDVANRQLGLAESAINRSNAISDYQLEQMKFNDNRYRTVGIPFEDQLLEDVKRFDSQGYKDQQVAAAMGDVQQGFSGAAEQQRRGLARMGVNPNSGKFAAANANMGFEQAKAMANAANKTRMAADQVGLSTKMQMYGGMKGLAGLGATNAGLATGAVGTGLGGLNAGVGAMGVGNSALGAMQGGASGMMGAGSGFLNANNANFSTAMGGMSAGISGLGNFTQLGQNATQINNASDPMGTILGAAAGIGTQWALGKVK